jgi:hypothetical protein
MYTAAARTDRGRVGKGVNGMSIGKTESAFPVVSIAKNG